MRNPRNEIYLPGLPTTSDPSAFLVDPKLHLGYCIKELELSLTWGKSKRVHPSTQFLGGIPDAYQKNK